MIHESLVIKWTNFYGLGCEIRDEFEERKIILQDKVAQPPVDCLRVTIVENELGTFYDFDFWRMSVEPEQCYLGSIRDLLTCAERIVEEASGGG